jgi:hypothetical protein
VTLRQNRIIRFVFAGIFAGLAVWGLAEAKYLTAASSAVFAAAWLLSALL